MQAQMSRKWQQILDKSTVHLVPRWILFFGLLAMYLVRVYYANGWFIVSYGLGIYLLNLFIGFLSPAVRCVVLIFSCRFHIDTHTDAYY